MNIILNKKLNKINKIYSIKKNTIFEMTNSKLMTYHHRFQKHLVNH
jgi:hypothetical protein